MRPLVLIAIAGLLAGCGAFNRSSAPGEKSLTTSIRGIIESEEQASSAINSAVQEQVRLCMKERGFKYTPSLTPMRSIVNDLLRIPTYGDLEWARNQGFSSRIVSDIPSKIEDPDTKGLNSKEKEAYFVALVGKSDPTDSTNLECVEYEFGTSCFRADACLSIASQKVVGDYKAWVKGRLIGETLANKRIKFIQNSSGWLENEKRWLECMRVKGYKFTDRNSAINSFLNKRAGESPSAEEKVVATKSAECDIETGVMEVWEKMAMEAEKKLLRERQADILAFAELQEKAKETARQLMKK